MPLSTATTQKKVDINTQAREVELPRELIDSDPFVGKQERKNT